MWCRRILLLISVFPLVSAIAFIFLLILNEYVYDLYSLESHGSVAFADNATLILNNQNGGMKNQSNRLKNWYSDKYTTYDCHKFFHKHAGRKPRFIVGGVHKGGSTSLFSYLALHGHIRPSCCKEIQYFSEDNLYNKGFDFYLRHFPSSKKEHMVTGEGTPAYIRDPYAIKRISVDLPDVKMIFSLRNPTERFISQYIGFFQRNKTHLTCNAYFKQEKKELDECIQGYKPEKHQILPTSNLKYSDFDLIQQSINGTSLIINEESHDARKCSLLDENCKKHYCLSINYENALSRSSYANQIVKWLQFFDPSQLFVLQSEKLFLDKRNVMQNLASFIGVRRFKEKEMQKFDTVKLNSKHHSSPLHESCDRQVIDRYFQEENQNLMMVIQNQNFSNKIDLSLWLKTK